MSRILSRIKYQNDYNEYIRKIYFTFFINIFLKRLSRMEIKIKYRNDHYNYYFNLFEKIKKYDNIVCLHCQNNLLTSLPKFPNSLQQLDCYKNLLTSII